MPRAFYSVGKHNSTPIHVGIKCRILSDIKTKARAVVGTGEKSLLSVLGSELRLGREKEQYKM